LHCNLVESVNVVSQWFVVPLNYRLKGRYCQRMFPRRNEVDRELTAELGPGVDGLRRETFVPG
jgi:hypothetical protein